MLAVRHFKYVPNMNFEATYGTRSIYHSEATVITLLIVFYVANCILLTFCLFCFVAIALSVYFRLTNQRLHNTPKMFKMFNDKYRRSYIYLGTACQT